MALLILAIGPHARKMRDQDQALLALAAAHEALVAAQNAAVEAPTANIVETQDELLAVARQRSNEADRLLRTALPEATIQTDVLLALLDLESGRAFDALEALLDIADRDRPHNDAPWTENTAMIQAAIAETRFKIALMCRAEGDGFENWSRFAEEAAHTYRDLAANPLVSPEERKHYLRNLAICTRLLHGSDENSHSLGFPVRSTVDCARIARVWRRPPPGGGGGAGGGSGAGDVEPWRTPPPEPDQDTIGR